MTTPAVPLTAAKRDWAKQFKATGVLKGKPLEVSAGDQSAYVGELRQPVNEMLKETKAEILALFHGEAAKQFFAQDASVSSQARILCNHLMRKSVQRFSKVALAKANRMVANVNASSKATLHGSLKEVSGGLSLKTSVMTGPLQDIFTALVANNVGLIKSIPREYHHDVQEAVMRSIVTGNGLQDLGPDLERIGGIAERRAKDIALDQTRKAYNSINQARMQALGLKQFEWLHSGGSQNPRPEHVELNGQIFDFAHLPIIDPKTGERGIPGQLPNCHCRMRPVITLDKGHAI